jgi:tetratricopeptide (TPR) repeat protein
MCNHGFIGRFLQAPSLAAALAPLLLFLFPPCSPMAAQMQIPGTVQPPTMHADEFDVFFGRPEIWRADAASFNGAAAPQTSGTSMEPKVSVDELRHPLTEKARRLLATALAYVGKGEHRKAIATLREGMAKVRALVPYAHGVLGVEYLRLGQTAEAVPELAEAATLFPHDAMVHSNLAVSLCMSGQTDRAEREARLALYLDPESYPAQVLLSDIEEAKARQARR